MFINQAMIVIGLSKISGLFNRVYFIKTFKNNICDFFVFETICAYPVEQGSPREIQQGESVFTPLNKVFNFLI